MIIREAQIDDIPEIQIVRNSVTENTLSDPNLVTNADCESFLTQRGKGWVCEINDTIVGFSIVDVQDHNIWALFITPESENQGIGKKLQTVMLDWYFQQTKVPVWLGTSPHTRAERFYQLSGWKAVGMHGNDEVKFEMTYEDWLKYKANNKK